jgi:hypothetical protein
LRPQSLIRGITVTRRSDGLRQPLLEPTIELRQTRSEPGVEPGEIDFVQLRAVGSLLASTAESVAVSLDALGIQLDQARSEPRITSSGVARDPSGPGLPHPC